MDDKNKISGFIRKRLENFDQETEDWERPDPNIRQVILSQNSHAQKSFFSVIKPLHIAAILLISLLGITSFLYLKNQKVSQAKIDLIYAELQVKNAEIEQLKQEVVYLQNRNQSSSEINNNEFTSHNTTNDPPLHQSINSKNPNNIETIDEKLSSNEALDNGLIKKIINDIANSDYNTSNYINDELEMKSQLVQKDKCGILDIEKLHSNNTLKLLNNPIRVMEVSKAAALIYPKRTHKQRSKNNLFVGAGVQFKPRPFKTEHKFNRKQPVEGQPSAKTKLFWNHFFEAEYMISDRMSIYAGFGTGHAKMTKKSKFDYEFDEKNTVTNANGEQYAEVEFRSSTNLGENEGLVSFEVPNDVQDLDKIDITLSNSFTVKSYNVPIGVNCYFDLNNKWSSFISGGLSYENLYINKYNVEASVAYKSKEVISNHLLKQPTDKSIQHINCNVGIGAAYAISSSWSIRGNLQWNRNLYNNGKKHPPRHFDVGAKVGIYYKI